MTAFFLSFAGFLLIHTLTVLTSFILSIHLAGYHIRSWLKVLLTTSLLYFSIVIGSQTLLGMGGVLTFPSVVIVQLGLFLYVFFRYGLYVLRNWQKIYTQELFVKPDWLLLAAMFAPVLIIAFTRFFNAALQVPVEYDNLAYHLPFVVEWMQSGNLWQVYYSAYAGPLGYYPSNYELLVLWNMLPFGNDLMVNLLNLPIFLLLPFALYYLARKLKVSHKPALMVVLLFLMLPVTLRQLGTPLVDLFFCYTFLLGLIFLREYIATHKLSDLALAGLALGLFMGTKYLGLVYSLPLIAIGIAWIFARFRKQLWARPLRHIGVLFASMTATGGFFYLRNLIDTGNPVFPTEVSFFGLKLFGGYGTVTSNLIETSLVSNVPVLRPFAYFFDRAFVMVGAPGIVVGICVLVYALVFLYSLIHTGVTRHKGIDRQRLELLAVSFIILLLLVFYTVGYWYSPYSFKDLIPNIRYAFMVILIAMLAMGMAVSRWKLLQPAFYLGGFVAVYYNFVTLILFPPLSILVNERVMLDFAQLSEYGFYALIFGLTLYAILLAFYFFRYSFGQKSLLPVSLVLLLCASSMSFVFFHDTRVIRESLRQVLYHAWYAKEHEWLDLLQGSEWFNTFAPTANIAYTGFNMHYSYFGRNLERKVDYVNINDCLSCRYKDFKDNPDSIRANPNPDIWIRNLRLLQKNFLVLKDDRGTPGLEHLWVRERPEIFSPVFRAGDVYIYAISNAPLAVK
ncbi:hypothetical protein COW46_04615 [Candidatus Gracilibacteria bacterium CG17_big_fil_post_rev_8_21_14_2_50_48_13]|nr:MAG: hypothetical protein COW46_04615 [Candidatus Gracilibacteria bacterium CG17_big_fil_post_rev_8_21_14_2_50_48_13]